MRVIEIVWVSVAFSQALNQVVYSGGASLQLGGLCQVLGQRLCRDCLDNNLGVHNIATCEKQKIKVNCCSLCCRA